MRERLREDIVPNFSPENFKRIVREANSVFLPMLKLENMFTAYVFRLKLKSELLV